MGRSYNTLKASDVTVTPVKLKYSASYYSSTFGPGSINVLTGSNGATSPTGSYPDSFLLYRSMRNRFYMQYISGSLLGSASAYEWFPQSTAATGTNDDDNRYFPTDPTSTINVITVPKANFGENIAKGSFKIKASSSIFNTVDDGNGNLVAESNHTIHVGNIFYPQGLAVITNPDYQAMFTVASTGGGGFTYPSGLIAAYDPAINVTSGIGGVVTSWGNWVSGAPVGTNLLVSTPTGANILPPVYVSNLINGKPGIKIQDSQTPTYLTGYVTQSLGFYATLPFNTYGPSFPTAITVIYVANIPSNTIPAASSGIITPFYMASGPKYFGTKIVSSSAGYIQTSFSDSSISPAVYQELDYSTNVLGSPPYGVSPYIISQTVSYGPTPLISGQINNTNESVTINLGTSPVVGSFNSIMTFFMGAGSLSAGSTIGTNFGEILIWSRQLSLTEIASVKNYLYTKYSITP